MYKCQDCDAVFEFPITLTEEYECYGRPSYETNACCPMCYGWALEEYDPDEYEEEDDL